MSRALYRFPSLPLFSSAQEQSLSAAYCLEVQAYTMRVNNDGFFVEIQLRLLG